LSEACTFPVTDTCGNQASGEQYIYITDTVPPSITTYSGCIFPPNDVVVCYPTSALLGPVTDICSSVSVSTGQCSQSGFYYDTVNNQYCVTARLNADYGITFTAVDACSNEAASTAQITSPSTNQFCSVFTSCDTSISGVSSSTANIINIDSYGFAYAPQYVGTIQVVVAEPVLTNWRIEIHFPEGDEIVRYSQYDVYQDGQFTCESSDRHLVVLSPQPYANTVTQGQTITIEYVATNNGRLSNDEILAATQLFVWTAS